MSAPVRPSESYCPTITVDCPTACLKAGDAFIVKADVIGGPPSKLTYNWSLSAGTITGGQGTPTITVDSTGSEGQTITATLEVGGLATSCEKAVSCSLSVCDAPLSRRFDKYGDLAFADEKKRLDYYAEQLKNEPGSQGHIMVYGKRGARAGDAKARADRVKEYLVTKLGIVADRLVTIEGGDHARFAVELWITPTGALPPSPVDDYGEPLEKF